MRKLESSRSEKKFGKRVGYKMKKINNFFKSLFSDPVEYLSLNYCKDKTDEELLAKLRSGYISKKSGNMIVLELLERLIVRKSKNE